MRVHLLSVPNTQVTHDFPLDGFCLRTWLFAELCERLGHQVILYGVEKTTAPCTTFVQVMTADQQAKLIGPSPPPYQYVRYDPTTPLFQVFNRDTQNTMRNIKRPGDIIATITGGAAMPVADAHPELPLVEYSIGYEGVAAKAHRIYQSHAWRHIVHGFSGVLGERQCDAVIPPWFHEEEFPVCLTPEPYVVYCGRIVPAKGISTVCDAAREAGVKLIVLGHGDPNLVTYGEIVDAPTHSIRNHYLSKASACLMPTQYVEPFGNVAAEAQLCGTPVISTDIGGFVDSVEHGKSGYRCTSLGEFVRAIQIVGQLDRRYIRDRAVALYGMDAGARQYLGYFRRLQAQMTGQGWHDLAPGLEGYGRPREVEHPVYAGSDCGPESGVSESGSLSPVDECAEAVA